MSSMGVTLVIATYNRGPRIGAVLDSVFAQTRMPVEVIVVDDCSTDGTGNWVEKHYPQVKLVRTPNNLYTSGARNFGARAATAKVLMFLDHDDLLHPHAVETLLGELAAAPEARAAFADHRYCNIVTGETYADHHTAQPMFHRLKTLSVTRSTSAGRVYKRSLYYALLRGNLLQQPWAVYRDTFLQLGGFGENVRYCEDWDLYLRVVRNCPVVVSDTVISDHQVEGENLHLTPNQEGMQAQVLRSVLRIDWYNLRSIIPIRRALAGMAKADGDRAPHPWASWQAYLKSVWYWPFDHVALARAIAILPARILTGRLLQPTPQKP